MLSFLLHHFRSQATSYSVKCNAFPKGQMLDDETCRALFIKYFSIKSHTKRYQTFARAVVPSYWMKESTGSSCNKHSFSFNRLACQITEITELVAQACVNVQKLIIARCSLLTNMSVTVCHFMFPTKLTFSSPAPYPSASNKLPWEIFLKTIILKMIHHKDKNSVFKRALL